jgi:hypothetical protein
MNIAHHVLLPPNQSLVLVPAMGGCDGLSGGVSATFLCYSKVPTTVTVNPERLTSGTAVVQADFAKAPSGYYLFLLVPALSVVLGGRYAAKRRARLRWEAVGMGAASGVVFAALVVVGSWLASVSAGLSSPMGGLPANASVLIGRVGAAGLLALLGGRRRTRGWPSRKFPPGHCPGPEPPGGVTGCRPAGPGTWQVPCVPGS